MEQLYLVISCLAALLLGYVAARLLDRTRLQSVRTQAEEIAKSAREEAEKIKKEAELKAKDDLYQQREEFKRETEQVRGELREQERRLARREDGLEEKNQALQKRERSLDQLKTKLNDRKAEVEKRGQEMEKVIEQQTRKLHEITGLGRDQAERMLMERLERELAEQIAARLQKHEEELRQAGEEKSRRILATAIHRYAAEHTGDTTVSTVDIPSDDMKGRIIGREGRNIRTFEKCTGVDVIVDDTPGVVIVSAFDNIRRETARLALTKLIQDGRIHPSRIEEVVTETQAEMEKHILEVGKQAVQEANIGLLHEKLIQLHGPAEVPHQLQSKRLAAQPGSVPPVRHDGGGAGAGRPAGAALRPACTTSARRPTTRWRAAIPRSAPNWPSATARRARKCCTPSPAITTT